MTIDNLASRPEFYYWYLIPTAVGLTLLVWTTKHFRRNADAKNICFTVSTYFLILLSQRVLIQIFFHDAWPTYFPHIATGLSAILVTFQHLLNRRDKKRSDEVQSHILNSQANMTENDGDYRLHPATIFKLPTENQISVIRDYYDIIKTVADRDFQLRIWIERSVPNFVSTLEEDRREILDDCFTYFIYHDVKDLGFGKDLIEALLLFRSMIAKLPYYGFKREKDILKSERWQKIVDQASTVSRLWESDPVAKKYSDKTKSKGYGFW